jgi:hypothetical protein
MAKLTYSCLSSLGNLADVISTRKRALVGCFAKLCMTNFANRKIPAGLSEISRED